MAKTIRNQYYKNLNYEKLMEAHIKSKKGKTSKEEIINFNLKQEEYIIWLLEELKNKTYKHGQYKTFYIKYPKERKIERSRYIDRVVHRWYVDCFLQEYFIKQFISTSYACIKNKGTHKACLDVQKAMKHCKQIWKEYYILKMDIAKFFQNINKDILIEILKRKIQDSNLMWLTKEIVYSSEGKKSLPIRELYITNICKHIFK